MAAYNIDNFKPRTFRLTDDYIKVCDFLEFKAKKLRMERNDYYSRIFRHSLDYMNVNGFKYVISEYKGTRAPKGISLYNDLSDYFDSSYNFFSVFYKKRYGRKLHIGEYVELLIYIYCIDVLDEGELKVLDVNFGIEKTVE